MQSPKQIIEKIRKIRFGIGLDINNTSEDVRAHIEDNKKFKDDASRVVSDLHTEKPHFILELIQNAEDNDYDENVKPTVRLISQGDKLILQNNETGFSEKNVSALCGIGETTKQNKKAGYIGEKGIGFKSVFMVTNQPHVYSNGFQFQFNYDEKNPISIIIPHWVDDIPHFVDSNKTNIVLPLKNEVKDELIKFTEIDPCLLLFLRKLRYIKIEDNIQNKSAVIERCDSEGKVKIVHPAGEVYYRIVKSPEPLKVPPHVKEEKRKDIIATEIVLAFPLTPDGSAETSTEQKVFVYLPVRCYGFKFIIQADFLVPPSREDIHKDESDKSWNKWLRDNIASIFLRAVEEFKSDEKLKKTYYNYIPLDNEVTDEFFSPLVSQIYSNLRESECILSESGNWLKPTGLLRANKDIRDLIPNDDLKKFFDKEYISSDIKANKPILDALGVQEFKFSHLVSCLQETEWLKQQSDEWLIRLYSYLNSQTLEKAQLEELKQLNILRLENNELASTIEKPVFSPLDKKGDYGFEKELRILKRTIFEPKEKKIKEAVGEFLKNVGVQDASPYEIIESHILPIYEREDASSNWQSKDAKLLLGYIRYIKANLQNYEKESDKHLNSNRKSWETKNNTLGRLKNSLYLRINKTVDGTNSYDRPENIYLPGTFGNKNNLEGLFEGIDGISYVHREYIVDIIKKYRQAKQKGKKSKVDIRKRKEAEIKEWREFFSKIGVEDKPRVILDSETLRKTPDYLSGLKLIWKKQRPDWKDSNSGYYIEDDYVCPDLEQILRNVQREKVDILIRIFETNWNDYKQKLQCKYWYHIPYAKSWNSRKTESSFASLLKDIAWLPTSKGNLAKPFEIFLDKPEIRELLGDTVPYLVIETKNKELIETLGINSEANVGGVLNCLKSSTEQKSEDKTAFTKLYEFLNKNYENNKDIINSAFSNNRIIYLPDNTERYFTSQEVFWKDVSDIFGQNRGYLEKHYPKLKSFFVANLDVSEKPKPKDYANVLIDLTQRQQVETEDEKIMLKIYKELNNHLNRENNEHLVSEEEWWNDFINEPIFWTDKEEFWKKHKGVFVNDNQELYGLFKYKPQIAFLKIPKNYYPKLQHFVEAAGLLYLTKAVKTDLADRSEIIEQKGLTKQIQTFAHYILQYLYQLEHDTYDRLKRNETLAQLKNLTCYSIENLEVKYTLNGQTVITQRNAILHNGNLYIQNDHLEDIDYLAVELSKLFGEIRGFDDFLILLFDKKTDEKIENLLRAKGVQELPEDEKEWFGLVELEREVIKGKEGGAIVEEKLPTTHIREAPLTLTPSETAEGPENVIGQEGIEKKEWRPECTPAEVGIHVEELQVLDKAQPEILEREKPHGKPEPPPKPPKETERDTLSQAAKVAIGRWGEEYALKCLKENLSDKYPKGKVEETLNGFTIRLDDLLIAEVHWSNAIDDRGEGYDIKIVKNNIEEYIEVKSTKTDTKDWFEVSDKQWKLMGREKDKFHIYRVYNAGTKEAKLIDIPNPYKKWEEGALNAYPIRIQV